MKVVRSAISVGALTLVSRITGLVREMLLNHILGSTWVTDAFIIAFKFPNFFRKFLSEGALNAAFVPFFSNALTQEGVDKARLKAQQIFTILMIVLALITVVVLVFTPVFVKIFAPGLILTESRLDLTIELTRITFGYVFFVCLCGLLSGILNSLDKFAVAAFVPVILNLFMIAALIIGLVENKTHIQTVRFLSWSVLFAGAAQFLWLYASLAKKSFVLKLSKPAMTGDVKTVMNRMVPGMIGAGVSQINLFVDNVLASLLPSGSISYLHYADRLGQLPLSVIGIALGTALLPSLSRQIKQKDKDAIESSQSAAIEWGILLSAPAMVGLLVLAHPIIDLIYGHGASTASDVDAISMVLMAFAIGIPGHVIAKILATIFFANNDTKTPVKIGAICVAANVVLNACLMPLIGAPGLALSTSLAGILNSMLLLKHLKNQGLFNVNDYLKTKIKAIGVVCILMGGFAYCLNLCAKWILGCQTLSCKGPLIETLVASALVLISCFFFALCCIKFKIINLQDIKKNIRKTN